MSSRNGLVTRRLVMSSQRRLRENNSLKSTYIFGGCTDWGHSFSIGRNIELENFIEISKQVLVIINYYYLNEETSEVVIAVDFSSFKTKVICTMTSFYQ